MPVILPQAAYAQWLDPQCDRPDMSFLLQPYPAEEMVCSAVCSLVNRASYDAPDFIQPMSSSQLVIPGAIAPVI
jgi:putative SOS response-associated peptidase YedK